MNRRGWVATSFISLVGLLAMLPAKPHYQASEMAPLSVPRFVDGWLGHDAAGELNLEDDRYRFIGRVFAREYADSEQHQLLLLVLDAGNFHHPKVCFSGSGFTVKELPSTAVEAAGRTIRVDPLYAERRDEGFLVLYWMAINGEVVDWSRQKWLQLWYSLLNRQRAGYMVRVDVRTTGEDEIPAALQRARHFISQTFSQIPEPTVSNLTGS